VDPLSGPVELTARAVIGDELRNPTAWCELTPCISWHGDPAALGEADIRARAIGSGWRVDAFGRLVCLGCQSRDPRFRTTHPVVPWDRRAAITRAALLAAAWEEKQSRVNALPGASGVNPAFLAVQTSSRGFTLARVPASTPHPTVSHTSQPTLFAGVTADGPDARASHGRFTRQFGAAKAGQTRPHVSQRGRQSAAGSGGWSGRDHRSTP
jgi:hypothetical protein